MGNDFDPAHKLPTTFAEFLENMKYVKDDLIISGSDEDDLRVVPYICNGKLL